VDCGGQTSGRAPGAAGTLRCRTCQAQARITWPEPLVKQALQTWFERYGKLPSSYDLSATHSRHRGGQALRRWREGFRDGLPWPSASIVTSRYGRYAAGIAAAISQPADAARETSSG
jgi:hypothetical protein